MGTVREVRGGEKKGRRGIGGEGEEDIGVYITEIKNLEKEAYETEEKWSNRNSLKGLSA